MDVELAYKDAKSDKVYIINQKGKEVQISFGRRGKTLQYQNRIFETAEEAKKFFKKKEKEKRSKGYVDEGSKFDSKRSAVKADRYKNKKSDFEVMKAGRLNAAKKRRFEKGALKAEDFLVSEKFDGWRALWDPEIKDFRKKDGGRLNAPESWVKRMEYLSILLARNPSQKVSLDGELYIGRGRLSDASRVLARKNWDSEEAKEEAWNQLSFIIFDSPSLNGKDRDRELYGLDDFESLYRYFNDRTENAFFPHPKYRLSSVPKKIIVDVKEDGTVVDMTTSEPVFFAPQFKVNDLDQLDDALYQAVERNAEGFMMRQEDSKHELGRVQTILKVKPAFTEEGLVVGYEEGLGRREGKVGSLLMQTKLKDGTKKRWKLGAGLTDYDTENPPPIGSVVEYKFRAKTKTGSPVEASFLRARPELDPKAYARTRNISGQRFVEGFRNRNRHYAGQVAHFVRRRFNRNARVIPKAGSWSVYIGRKKK